MKNHDTDILSFNLIDILCDNGCIRGLYIDERINDKTIPDGIYKYEIRTNDNGSGDFVTLEPSVKINFGGTVLLNKKIDLNSSPEPDDLFLDIEGKYTIYFGSDYPQISLKDYIKGV